MRSIIRRVAFLGIVSLSVLLLANLSMGELIGEEDFSPFSILIDFEDIQRTDPHTSNGALSPIPDYESLGVTFFVRNEMSPGVDPKHDIFRLGGFSGEGRSIATNVGDNASIEAVFSFPVSQVGALVAVSNASLEVFGGKDNLLEQAHTTTVVYDQSPSSPRLNEFIGVENESGIRAVIFQDISLNGLILALDNFRFTPGYDAVVGTDLEYYTNVRLSDRFSFDYWWEMGQEPEGFNLDILFFSGGEWMKFFAWELTFDGSSTEWETASFVVPEYLRGLETELRFRVFDFGANTDPTVYLRNINSSTAPVPEPSTILLLGAGLIGLAGVRRKFWK